MRTYVNYSKLTSEYLKKKYLVIDSTVGTDQKYLSVTKSWRIKYMPYMIYKTREDFNYSITLLINTKKNRNKKYNRLVYFIRAITTFLLFTLLLSPLDLAYTTVE